MLASMRTAASSFVMKALMLFLVLSFAVWGAGDMVRSGNGNHLAKVGDETVNYPAYARNVSLMERSLQAMGVTTVDRRMLQDQVLRRMVEEKLILLRLRDAGFDVNDQLLAARLRDTTQFHDVRGKFDPAIFKATLEQRQLSEATFLDELKSDIRASLFSATISPDSMTPPESVLALYEASARERRDAVVVTIASGSVSFTAPDEAALKEYYEVNKQLRYLDPERRTLEYVTFEAGDLQKLVEKELTDEALHQRYDEQQDRFADKDFAAAKKELQDEMRSELTETIATDITTRVEDALAAGDSMGEAIAKAGLSTRSRLLENVTKEQFTTSKDPLIAAVATQGFEMMDGETSSISTTDKGTYYMVSVRGITPATPKPYAQVAADVKTRASADARAQALRLKAGEVKDALEKSDDWKTTLQKLGANGRVVSSIRRPELGATAGLPPVLVESVFEHAVGGVAGPLMQENGDAVLAKVTAITPDKTARRPDAKTTEALGKEFQQEVMQQLYRDLTSRYPVRINEPLMQQINGNGDGA